MKIIFVLDEPSQPIIVVKPEELQLRQVADGIAALVVSAGKNEAGEEMIYSLLTYPVVLVTPPVKVTANPVTSDTTAASTAADATPVTGPVLVPTPTPTPDEAVAPAPAPVNLES
jgi:hypothetical protein